MSLNAFDEAYKKLNKAQKQAVDTIEGPVMVVAGPGTGKTQVLALRIAHILKKTDTKPDGVLCLTFTNSGVRAMKERLESYIGPEADKVIVSTFHSFAINLIEKNYELLDFPTVPKLLADEEAVFVVDELLHENEWEYLRPRSNPTLYFNDLKQLISLLKRERISAREFLSYVESDIKNLTDDPDSISSRGESKGKLKKEIEKKIESLSRTREVVEFYRLYEKKKKERALIDYDDALEYAVRLAEEFEDVRADIRENYLYILVDEHQDSSGVQNSFLKAVWKDTDMPNIFVVGDDRQLIYAFSGASLSYFEEFSHIFGKAELITLVENYRSTAPILSLADDLLKSSITHEVLKSNKEGKEKIVLSEYAYPRDEIIGAGLYFKKAISLGTEPSECALLVPRNYHVRSAIETLHSMGIPVSSGKNLSLFQVNEAEMMRRILSLIVNPNNNRELVLSLLDPSSGIKALDAHTFLRSVKPQTLTIDDLVNNGKNNGLFAGENPISQWGVKLKKWVNELSGQRLSRIISVIGHELLVDTSRGSDELHVRVEVVRSFIHLATMFEEKDFNASLEDFLLYIDRLRSYGTHIELAKFSRDTGVSVMTLHKSKGLEYNSVWIAHMNEEILMSEKKAGFTLPEKIKEHIKERDIEMAKRELYVAITRAKKECLISYSSEDHNGRDMNLAHIIKELPEDHFIKNTKETTENEILSCGPETYIPVEVFTDVDTIENIKELVKNNYTNAKVSVTLLNNFFECPWKWYFRNFLCLPEIKTLSLALGSAVHSTIEYILKSKSLPSENELRNKIETELMREGIASESEMKKLIKDAEKAVAGWIKNYYTTLAKDFSSERSLQMRDEAFPHLMMYGKIDLTERFLDNTVVVTDFKTGNSKAKSMIEKIDENGRMSDLMRQLAMYSYLIKGSEKGTDVASSRLLFLESDGSDKNSLYTTHIDQEKIDLLKRDIEEYDHALKSGEWMNRTCCFTPYGATHQDCEYCKKAKILGIEKTL
jgi:DNA helicase II / ATP-dependent DNA helicase PcrA